MNKKKWHRFIPLIVPILYFLSYQFPIWIFQFVAPQYPRGLTINIHLNKVTGDVVEIDIINHYIGMAKLSEAASLERQYGFIFVILFSIASIMLVVFPKKKWVRWLNLAGLAFPIVFIVTFFGWLYHFGHALDPAAPIHLQPFTPSIIGYGMVGNFKSFAYPGPSFYLIAGASLALGFNIFRKL